jgi:ABC-type antimicrobial peptide transport system permease subunit
LEFGDMSSLLLRRIMVWAIGMGTGTLIGWLIITFLLPALSPDPNARAISIQEYGIIYFLTTVVPLGLIFVTWLDYYLDTRIWPD